MPKKIVCLVLTLCWLMASTALAEQPRIHAFGGSGKDLPMDAIPLQDGGFLLAGNTLSMDGDVLAREDRAHAAADAWAIRLDSSYHIVFQILISDSVTAQEQFSLVKQLPDESFVLLYEFTDLDHHKFRLLHYSSSGKFMDELPLPQNTRILREVQDGFIAGGGFRDYYGNEEDKNVPWLTKISYDGTVVWHQTYAAMAPWSILDIYQEGDVLFCAGKWREAFEYSGNIVCLDAAGNFLWDYKTEPDGFTTLNKIAAMPDGGAIAVGWKSGPYEDDGGIMVRVDNQGNQQFKKTIYRPDVAWFTDIIQTEEGSLISGLQMYERNGRLYSSGWLLRINAEGKITHELGGDLLPGADSSLLIQAKDHLAYYITSGGPMQNVKDFFLMQIANLPEADYALDEFGGMEEFE